jgi:hypothetical protein
MPVYATSNSNTTYLIGSLMNVKLGETSPDSGAGPLYTAGTRAFGKDGSQWMYVGPTTAAINQYDVVWVNASMVPAQITANLAKTAGFVGFAQIAFATSESGWVMLSGKPTLNAVLNTTVGAALYTCATSGFLDDATASTSQLQIFGVVLSASASVTATPAVAAFPTVRGVHAVQ